MADAATAKSRAWFFPTSPRSPHKLQGELALLKTLEGKIWNVDTQTAFAHMLRESADFDGNISKTDPAFTGRDRATRAPRLLGFVEFPPRGSKGSFKFTDAGNLFLKATLHEHGLIFQRQIAKVQFTSPLHASRGFEDMSVKPLMVMIRLLLQFESMSKTEVALFGVTLTDEKKLDARIKDLADYRGKLRKLATGERKVFRRDFANAWVEKIYKEDIAAGNTKVREGNGNIRYLRATGLFTVSPHGQRLMLLNTNIEDAKFLLTQYGIGLSQFTKLDFSEYVVQYLGNPSLPVIRKDDETLRAGDLERMLAQVTTTRSAALANEYRKQFLGAKSRTARLQVITQLEILLAEIQVAGEARRIRENLTLSLSTIG